MRNSAPLFSVALSWTSLPLVSEPYVFSIDSFSGCLRRTLATVAQPPPTQAKLSSALALCDDPYCLQASHPRGTASPLPGQLLRGLIVLRALSFLCKTHFFLARVYAAHQLPLFHSAQNAVAFFHKHTRIEDYDRLCLPRALFAAKTSAKFEPQGVLLIGAFLPSRLMHAWLIESSRNPDPRDLAWHHYRPLAALS